MFAVGSFFLEVGNKIKAKISKVLELLAGAVLDFCEVPHCLLKDGFDLMRSFRVGSCKVNVLKVEHFVGTSLVAYCLFKHLHGSVVILDFAA